MEWRDLMYSTEQLVSEANFYLDNLTPPSCARDAERAISKLTKLRDAMVMAGFNRSLPLFLIERGELVDSDAARQLRIFRDSANLKRYTLQRVAVALAAHKIYASAVRRTRQFEFVAFLPFSGNWLAALVRYGEPALFVYKKIALLLAARRGRTGYSVTYIDGARRARARLASADDIAALERRGALIVGVRELARSGPLVTPRAARTAIACAYALYAVTQTRVGVGVDVEVDPKYAKYAQLLKAHGLAPLARIDNLEGNEELKDLLYSEGLLLWDGDWRLEHSIAQKITGAMTKASEEAMAIAQRAIAEDVLDFLLSETRSVRAANPIFPGMPKEPNTEQFAFLKAAIAEPFAALDAKIYLEKVAGLSQQAPDIAAALFYTFGKDLSWCAQRFKVDEGTIHTVAKQIAAHLEQQKELSQQARKFLELIK